MLPTNLIGRVIQVNWKGIRGVTGFHRGEIVGLVKNNKRFYVKYDLLKDKDGSQIFEEDLLGLRPPEWMYDDLTELEKNENKGRDKPAETEDDRNSKEKINNAGNGRKNEKKSSKEPVRNDEPAKRGAGRPLGSKKKK